MVDRSSWRIGVCALLLLIGGMPDPVVSAQGQALIPSVRAALGRQDFAGAERLIADYRAAKGVTPEMLEAHSWLGRGALASRQWERADAYARQTYAMVRATLAARPLDQEPRLPIALGASIEVQAQVSAQLGARTEGISFLEQELRTYKGTSIVKRLQKNLNLLSLEGTPAPALDLSESLAPRPTSLAAVKGKVVVLFFWAHWCPDCKAQSAPLAALERKFGPKGLAVLAPTQRYGYVAGGRAAGADEERTYIAEIRRTHYAFLPETAVPLSDANHQRYGVSTTPTLVVLDRRGMVRLYHPGAMTEAELDPLLAQLTAEGASPAGD
jgi:thiol-disulfide isomerase/thioredoxin